MKIFLRTKKRAKKFFSTMVICEKLFAVSLFYNQIAIVRWLAALSHLRHVANWLCARYERRIISLNKIRAYIFGGDDC